MACGSKRWDVLCMAKHFARCWGTQPRNHQASGHGTTVKICEDPWLPRNWDRKPFTPRGNTIISSQRQRSSWTHTQRLGMNSWWNSSFGLRTLPLSLHSLSRKKWRPDGLGTRTIGCISNVFGFNKWTGGLIIHAQNRNQMKPRTNMSLVSTNKPLG